MEIERSEREGETNELELKGRREEGELTSSAPPFNLLTSISIPSRAVSAGRLTAGPIGEPSTEDLNWTTTVGALAVGSAGLSEGPESFTRLGGGTLKV